MFLGASITFLVIAALLLWLVIGSKGHWSIKIFAILCGTWYSVAIFNTLPTILGWPSKEELPEKYEVFWVKVYEPVKGQDDKGHIDIWVRDLNKNSKTNFWSLFKPNEKDSRLYRLPYSRELHEKMNFIAKLLKSGRRVMGENTKGKSGRGKRKGRKSGDGYSGEEGDLNSKHKFYLLPPPKMGDKN